LVPLNRHKAGINASVCKSDIVADLISALRTREQKSSILQVGLPVGSIGFR
jgi:hypothetical protein